MTLQLRSLVVHEPRECDTLHIITYHDGMVPCVFEKLCIGAQIVLSFFGVVYAPLF